MKQDTEFETLVISYKNVCVYFYRLPLFNQEFDNEMCVHQNQTVQICNQALPLTNVIVCWLY